MAQTKKKNRRKKVRRQYHTGKHGVNKIGQPHPHDPNDPNHNNPLDDTDRDIPGGGGGNDGADDPPPVDDEGNPILQPGDPGYDPASASQITAPTKPIVTTGTVAQAGDTAVREIEFVDSPPVEIQEGSEGTFTNLLNTAQDPSQVKPDPETPSNILVEKQPEPTLASTTYTTEVPSKTLTSVVDDMGTGTVTKGTAPEAIEASTYDATQIAPEDVPTVKAAQGELSEGAIAQVDERALSERAQAARRDTTQEQAALTRQRANYEISDGSYVDKVTGKISDIAPTSAAELTEREAILGQAARDGTAAEIIDSVGYQAAQLREVKGTAAKGAAAEMVAAVGELPPAISATIVENPATVEAQVDNEPIEVQAAIAALPTEALVSAQMETLLGGIEDGDIPVWAKPAVDLVNRQMRLRGLDASTVGRDALFNAIVQSALPIAQSNAQALQQRSAQNLTNQQQAAVQEANLNAQRRLQNVSNSQTAASQTAQMAQQMATMQSQFAQDAIITSAAQAQQTRLANLQNRQQSAIQNVQNQQASNAQNLGNEQQTELANLQFEFQTNAANMSAENQARLVEMQTAADFLSKNAGFKQQMELANLSNEQQIELANLTALNQADSESLTATQQTRLANLDARLKTNLTQADIASKMNVAQLSVDQQRAVQNATMVANIDLNKFNADQQVILTNSKFMQSMTMTDFSARQQEAMQNATALASLDLANLDAQTKLAAQNAQSFLQMDMANLNNRQQAAVLDAQMMQQTMLSNQAADNAAKQFNATSENQTRQFNQNMAQQMEMFNVQQQNSMEQFNASEKNRLLATEQGIAGQLMSAEIGASVALQQAEIRAESAADLQNTQLQAARDQFNSQNAFINAQATVEYERKTNLIDTAAMNEMNKLNAQQEFQLSAMEYEAGLMEARDNSAYLRQTFENDKNLKTQLYIAAIGNETAAGRDSDNSLSVMQNFIDGLNLGG
jgi:hypothetical protein